MSTTVNPRTDSESTPIPLDPIEYDEDEYEEERRLKLLRGCTDAAPEQMSDAIIDEVIGA